MAQQKKMAELFEVDRSVITKHLRNIFAEGELEEKAVSAIFAHTAVDGKHSIIWNPGMLRTARN